MDKKKHTAYTMEYYSAINKSEMMSSAGKWMEVDISC
jgi:hypothetical protein